MEGPPENTAADSLSSQSPEIYTYHCICTNLILASTKPLSALRRRGEGSLDKAYILSLPPPPHQKRRSSVSSQDSDSDPRPAADTPITNGSSDYALLLSTVLDRKPQVVRRADGFETRYIQRCGRCRLIIGYQLDWVQFPESELEKTEDGTTKSGRRGNIIYLLPGGLQTTGEMTDEKDMSTDIGFGLDKNK